MNKLKNEKQPAADYSGGRNTNQHRNHNVNFTLDNPSTTETYSSITKATETFPINDEAIILIPTEGIPIREYILALGTLIGPENIIFYERISQNRICVFLKLKTFAETVVRQ